MVRRSVAFQFSVIFISPGRGRVRGERGLGRKQGQRELGREKARERARREGARERARGEGVREGEVVVLILLKKSKFGQVCRYNELILICGLSVQSTKKTQRKASAAGLLRDLSLGLSRAQTLGTVGMAQARHCELQKWAFRSLFSYGSGFPTFVGP